MISNPLLAITCRFWFGIKRRCRIQDRVVVDVSDCGRVAFCRAAERDIGHGWTVGRDEDSSRVL